MSESKKGRIELRLALGLLALAACAIGVMGVLAATPPIYIPGEVLEAAHTVAGLNPMEIMSMVAILALMLCAYLIRLLFGRLQQVRASVAAQGWTTETETQWSDYLNALAASRERRARLTGK